VQRQGLQLGQPGGRLLADGEAEGVAQFSGRDDQCNAAGEAGRHRERDEADQRAGAQQSAGNEQRAGHHRRDEQAIDAEALDDARDQYDEGAGGSADLHARAAEAGNDRPGDDGGDEALARGDAGRDAEGDGKRDGHHPDDHAGGEVLEDLGASDCGEGIEQLRSEARHGGQDRYCRRVAGTGPDFRVFPLLAGGGFPRFAVPAKTR